MQKQKSITEKFQANNANAVLESITANATLNHGANAVLNHAANAVLNYGTTIVLALMGLCLVGGYILSISWHTVAGAILAFIPTPLLFVLDKVDEIKAYVAEKSGAEWEAE